LRPAPGDQLLQNSPRVETQQGYAVERCVWRFFIFQPDTSSLMQFFVDTANLDQIREAAELGILDGVTTNPSLMAKEGITGEKNILKHYRDICDIVGEGRDVSAEVIATDFKGMVAEGRQLAELHENIVVKVPMIKDGVKAIAHFSELGIRTNCTLVFSAGQAILAAKAGATYLSPFIGRIDDISWDGMSLIKEIFEIYSTTGYQTAILAASIRSPLHIVQAAKAGADVVTCPLSAILGLLNHPLTDIGLEKFLADYRKGN
jgi:transaldolase